MKCREFQDYLPLYQRGMLEDEMSKQISRHLASCEVCREALAVENRISGRLDTLFGKSAVGTQSARIAEIVLERSRGEDLSVKRGRSRMKLVFRFGAVAATVVLVLWLSFLFRHSPATGIDLVQEAPIRTVFMNESPVRTPELRDVQRKATVTRLKENVIWVSYTN